MKAWILIRSKERLGSVGLMLGGWVIFSFLWLGCWLCFCLFVSHFGPMIKKKKCKYKWESKTSPFPSYPYHAIPPKL